MTQEGFLLFCAKPNRSPPAHTVHGQPPPRTTHGIGSGAMAAGEAVPGGHRRAQGDAGASDAEEGFGAVAANRCAPVDAGAAPAEQLGYGAVRPGDGGARRSDRLGAILGAMAVAALVLGLAQVADVGGRRAAAAGGLGKRVQALSALSTGAQHSGIVTGKPARLRQLQIARAGMLQEAGPAENATAAPPAGEPADAEASASQRTADGECCACPAAETAPAGGADAADPGPAAADANATDAAGANATAAGPAPAAAGPATARASAGGLRLRKLLQEDDTGAAANASAGGAEGANAEPAGDAAACCPCAGGAAPASQKREVPVIEDWSSSALPHTAWDSVLGLLKVVGEGVYDDVDTGYHAVHVEDGICLLLWESPSLLMSPSCCAHPRDLMRLRRGAGCAKAGDSRAQEAVDRPARHHGAGAAIRG